MGSFTASIITCIGTTFHYKGCRKEVNLIVKHCSNRPLTPFGLEVKKRLLELQITQREFCRRENIPENRMSEILYGDRVAKYHRDLIAEKLDIKLSA
jgi:predicted transcriptional regulator